MPQDKSSSAVAKGLKMTKFGSNAATVVEKASSIISSAKNNKDGSGGDRTGDQSIATSNTSGTSSCHHHYHHHYPPKHRRTASGTQSLVQNLLAYPGLGHSGPLDLDGGGSGGGSSGGECPSNCTSSGGPQVSSLPPSLRVRLYELFVQIEREFEVLYAENISLQEKVDTLTAASTAVTPSQIAPPNDNLLQPQTMASTATNTSILGNPNQQTQPINNNTVSGSMCMPLTPAAATSTTTTPLGLGLGPSSNKMSRALYAHKLRTHTNKLKQQTNKIMSNLKGPPALLNCTPLRRYTGHRDGIWEVSVSRMRLPILGTASADHTAIIWGMHSGQALLQYTGHAGSVNSLRFHPTKELVLTASGDGTAHIWQCAVHLTNESSSGRMASSEDELDPLERESQAFGTETEESDEFSVLRTPLRALSGHNGVVIAADWLPGGEQAVTAGWDRMAILWDTQTGQQVHQLSGHDEELTHTAAHPTARLVVTASKDSTFRLWDFREQNHHSVSVFQGHTDTVTCAVFSPRGDDQIISGSDDRTARIWDLRNMRSPVATIQSDSAVNRLAVSANGLVAIPFDNRNVRIYDMSGQRAGRLPRSSRQGHARMVCACAWSDDTTPNLFTCGFDRVTLGWSVQPRENQQTAIQQQNSEADLGISSAFALRMQSGQSDSKENQAPKDGK